jgi:hypothetical protein
MGQFIAIAIAIAIRGLKHDHELVFVLTQFHKRLWIQ